MGRWALTRPARVDRSNLGSWGALKVLDLTAKRKLFPESDLVET
jgi:hypothetical protein